MQPDSFRKPPRAKPATDGDYEVIVGYFGKHFVRYSCKFCQERLRSQLRQAGQIESCPNCDSALEVPGREELARLRNELDLPRTAQIKVLQLKNQAELETLEYKMLKEFDQAKQQQDSRFNGLNKSLSFEFEEAIRNTEFKKKNWKEELLLKLSSKCAKKIEQICDMQISDSQKKRLVERIFAIRRTATSSIINGSSDEL